MLAGVCVELAAPRSPRLLAPRAPHPHHQHPPPLNLRFLPDKAIDLVDEAAAKLKMEITSKPEALDEIDRKVLQLEMERLSLQKVRCDEARQGCAVVWCVDTCT
jgi:hypothetical protein